MVTDQKYCNLELEHTIDLTAAHCLLNTMRCYSPFIVLPIVANPFLVTGCPLTLRPIGNDVSANASLQTVTPWVRFWSEGIAKAHQLAQDDPKLVHLVSFLFRSAADIEPEILKPFKGGTLLFKIKDPGYQLDVNRKWYGGESSFWDSPVQVRERPYYDLKIAPWPPALPIATAYAALRAAGQTTPFSYYYYNWRARPFEAERWTDQPYYTFTWRPGMGPADQRKDVQVGMDKRVWILPRHTGEVGNFTLGDGSPENVSIF